MVLNDTDFDGPLYWTNYTYVEETHLSGYLWKERQKTLEHCQRKVLFLKKADGSKRKY